jgi:hypothetical protein
VKLNTTPTLDSRSASDVMDELLALQPAWTPELAPSKGEPAYALYQIFSRFMQSSIGRLNQAPDKNLLAFLDTFGVEQIPPQPSRAPVVFMNVPNSADAVIPARTRLSARLTTQTTPLIFETEQDGAMAAARLTDVVTVWPARDSYTAHSGSVAGKRTF